ncbi:cytochrome c biogenesis CcdA family protein [Methylobacterium sp. A54F]
MLGLIGLSALAGLLSILSPCVLPLVPVVLGTAAGEHRLGPLALAGGLALSFTAIGLFVATVGFAIGLDTGLFRAAAAILLILLGLVLALPSLQARLAAAGGPAGAWVEHRFGGFSAGGLPGQFGVGLLLGAVWAPCVGPTLGAASLLAAKGERLGEVALVMLAFGVGAALPLLALGLLSRGALLRWRTRLSAGARVLKPALGVLLAVTGLMILSGLDKRAEAYLVGASPDWLVALTTRY